MTFRKENWPSKLERCREAHEKLSFEWGKSDCMSFAADCVLAMTGIDPMAAYRGKYSDMDGAIAIIENGGGVEQLIDNALKSVQAFKANKEYCARGDIVLIEYNGKSLAGVWFGHFALAPFPNRGLCRVPLEYVKECWGII